MDSVTQLALGAAVGAAIAGRQVGRRAVLWGAVCGTLPDLDVFVPLGDAVRDFTYHRSASHSLFVQAALTPLVVWLILKLHPGTAEHRWRWFALVYLAFVTHALLDCFTVYGTQILWPLPVAPVAWSTIFIIDPLYTVPLLAGVVAALVAGNGRSFGHGANAIGLVLSSIYLVWTLGAKLYVEDVARGAIARSAIGATDVLSTPTPFNSLLWRIVAVDATHYYEGFYSLLDEVAAIDFVAHRRSLELVEPLRESAPVRRLQWFTRNFYAASRAGDDIIISDLRMGLEPDFVFRFRVGRMGNPHPYPAPVERRPGVRSFERLRWVWARIRDRTAR